MLNKLLRQKGTANGSLIAGQNQGVISGLLIYKGNDQASPTVTEFGKDEFVTVTKRSADGTDVLIQRMSLQMLGAYSSINNGMDLSLSKFISDTSVDNAEEPVMHVAAAVSFGQIDLVDAELDIQISLNSAAADYDYGIYTYRLGVSVDYVQKYSLTQDSSPNFGKCMEVFANGGAHVDREYLVRADSETYIVDQQGVFSLTAVMSNVALPEEALHRIYQSVDEIPDNVNVVVTGNTGNLELLAIHREYKARDIQRSIIREEQKHAIKLSKLEPETANALEHLG